MFVLAHLCMSEAINQGNRLNAVRAVGKIITTLTNKCCDDVSHVIPHRVSDETVHPSLRVREAFLTHFLKWRRISIFHALFE